MPATAADSWTVQPSASFLRIGLPRQSSMGGRLSKYPGPSIPRDHPARPRAGNA
jgi:hypothetical protein